MRRDTWYVQVVGEFPPRYFAGFAFSADTPKPCWTGDIDTAEIFSDYSAAEHAANNCTEVVTVTRGRRVRK